MGKFFVGQKPGEVDLLSGDYTMVRWPFLKLHGNKFPYLAVRVFSGVYSIVPLKASESDGDIRILITWAKNFAREYGFKCCLVVGPKLAYYIEPDGRVIPRDEPPSGGSIISWVKFQNGEIKFTKTAEGGMVFYAQEGEIIHMVYSPGKPAQIDERWLKLLHRLPRPVTDFILRFLQDTGLLYGRPDLRPFFRKLGLAGLAIIVASNFAIYLFFFFAILGGTVIQFLKGG